MACIIKMPSLSPTMKAGKVVEWFKKEGDTVTSGDVIVTIETDKALMELESVDEGILTDILYPNGSEGVAVGVPIAYLLEDGDEKDAVEKLKKSKTSAQQGPSGPPEEKKEAPQAAAPLLAEPKESPQTRMFITPLARRLAQERGIDLASIQGTGPKGRICRRDIEAFPNAQNAKKRPIKSVEPLSDMRKIIGRRLLESKTTIPHFYVDIDIAMDAAEDVKNVFKRRKKPITLHHIIMRAVALALQDSPYVNVHKEEDSVRFLDASDVSFALSLPGGLVTPIVFNAQEKSLCVISEEVRALSAKAREGRLKAEEFQGGSLCVTNLGMYGVRAFSAIINPPQATILAVGALRREPYITAKGLLAERAVMTCTLSADHRLIDGVVAAEFLQCVKDYLESPVLLTV